MSDTLTDPHAGIKFHSDPNDPTLYLAAASRALYHYRQATRRHGMNDLRTFEYVEDLGSTGEYRSFPGAREVMRQMLASDLRIDADPEGYEWDWWQDKIRDTFYDLGIKAIDDETHAEIVGSD
jgi:hypothetical protein